MWFIHIHLQQEQHDHYDTAAVKNSWMVHVRWPFIPFPNNMLPEFWEAEVRLHCDCFASHFIAVSHKYRQFKNSRNCKSGRQLKNSINILPVSTAECEKGFSKIRWGLLLSEHCKALFHCVEVMQKFMDTDFWSPGRLYSFLGAPGRRSGAFWLTFTTDHATQINLTSLADYVQHYTSFHEMCKRPNLIWSEPVPKLSSPHKDSRPASIRLPKNFQPVGTSNISFPLFLATLHRQYNKTNVPSFHPYISIPIMNNVSGWLVYVRTS